MVVFREGDVYTRRGTKTVRVSEYREKAWNRLAEFAGWQMSWIPRKWNERADKRVDEAFASAAPGGEITHAEDSRERAARD